MSVNIMHIFGQKYANCPHKEIWVSGGALCNMWIINVTHIMPSDGTFPASACVMYINKQTHTHYVLHQLLFFIRFSIQFIYVIFLLSTYKTRIFVEVVVIKH